MYMDKQYVYFEEILSLKVMAKLTFTCRNPAMHLF